MSKERNLSEKTENSLREIIVDETTELVILQTWRDENYEREEDVQKNLKKIKEIFDGKIQAFNEDPKNKKLQIRPFEWRKYEPGNKFSYWVFGYSAGSGARKITLICHLDTVPPGSNEWKPFDPRIETRIYKGIPTEFLIGRGAIDDKGPAVVALNAFVNAIEEAENQSCSLDNVTLEVLFDTSEETGMSTPHYFDDNKDQIPDLGIVFDAYWAVHAEKGIERPVFVVTSADMPAVPDDALRIDVMESSEGSPNMIPFSARAHIRGPADRLKSFGDSVEIMYRACPFDSPDYHPADIQVTRTDEEVVITTLASGAQHGSAPHQNRAEGANPVVSLTNFLAFLVENGILAHNFNGEMSRFIRWAFGTRVFGENHPDLLSRFDTVFREGNGTTYALTQLTYSEAEQRGPQVNLSLDVRYAIGHHSRGWDGSDGTISGDSVFQSVFDQLVRRYQSEAGGQKVTFTTCTIENFGPDIRSPRNANLFRVGMAYRSVMGENCPMYATGGATDAHGWLSLVTAGALFTTNMGPPVNYHGLDEGAPLIDLENSYKILFSLLKQECQAVK